MALSSSLIAPSDDKLQVDIAEVLEYGAHKSWQSTRANQSGSTKKPATTATERTKSGTTSTFIIHNGQEHDFVGSSTVTFNNEQ